MVSEAEIQENHEKNDSKNHVFFACVFKSILERFGKGFGKVLGGFAASLASLGSLLCLLFSGFVTKRAQETAKRCLGLDF